MNILLTSVGRRSYIVDYFKEVIGKNGQVHVCNSDDLSCAFNHADKFFISPLIYDEDYIPVLLKYCKDNSIDILISLFDIDLPILSANKDKFAQIGTKVIVSDLDFINICNDKWKTFQFLKSNNFNAPKTYLHIKDIIHALETKEVNFPIILKPRFGCGSIGIEVADNIEELKFFTDNLSKKIRQSYLKYESKAVRNNEQIIYQEFIKGQEYGADIINDLKGKCQNVVIRKKLAMRSGETDIAEIVQEPLIRSELLRLGKITNHIANLDCDIIKITTGGGRNNLYSGNERKVRRRISVQPYSRM